MQGSTSARGQVPWTRPRSHHPTSYNEASTQGTIPPDAFSRDLHEPSVDLGSGADVETTTLHQADAVDAPLASAEVMEVE